MLRSAPLEVHVLALLTATALGLTLGMRHALEPDHLAAVSTLVADSPGSARAYRLGGFWGLGHTLSLLGVGAALLALRATLPGWLEDLFELGVGVMLLALGGLSLARLARPAAAPSAPRLGRRSLLVGMAHGLAGSGALTALALAAMPTPLAGLGYIALFGAGSALGMALLTGLAGWGFREVLAGPRTQLWLRAAVGLLSVAAGLVWAAPRAERLLAGSLFRPAPVAAAALR